jgi:C-terminal processing protease CtpA/Prc
MIGAPQSVESGGQIQIIEVIKDSPAAQAGVLVGDVILGADNQLFVSVSEMQAYVNSRSGNEVVLKVLRLLKKEVF